MSLDTFVLPEHRRFTLRKFGWPEEKTSSALKNKGNSRYVVYNWRLAQDDLIIGLRL